MVKQFNITVCKDAVSFWWFPRVYRSNWNVGYFFQIYVFLCRRALIGFHKNVFLFGFKIKNMILFHNHTKILFLYFVILSFTFYSNFRNIFFKKHTTTMYRKLKNKQGNSIIHSLIQLLLFFFFQHILCIHYSAAL